MGQQQPKQQQRAGWRGTCPYKYAIILHLRDSPRPLAVVAPIRPLGFVWYHSSTLFYLFFLIFTRRPHALLAMFMTLATFGRQRQHQIDSRRRGGGIARQQGKRGVSGNIMCVAGIGPHIVLCDIFICWFACNLFIFMRIICIWQIFMMPTKRHSLPACQLRCCNISNSNKPKQKREEATDWSMNNNNKWMYNVLDSK